MTPAEILSPDLRTVLRRLKLSRMSDTLPERFLIAREQKMPYQDFLLLVLSDEASRRDSQSALLRAKRARLEPDMQLEAWDWTARVSFDRALFANRSSSSSIWSHVRRSDSWA
jgi:hypothetical protein